MNWIGWDLVPIPKIVLAEDILATYFRDRRSSFLKNAEINAALVTEILQAELHNLSVVSLGFCLRSSGSIDWDFVEFPKTLKSTTILEVSRNVLEICCGIPMLRFNAEFVAMVLQVHEDALMDEFLKDSSREDGS